MAGKPALSWINWVDFPGVTFEASNELLALPASNLADEDANQVWGVSGLTAGSTSFYVDIDLLEECEIDVFALILGWRLDRPEKLRQTPLMAATDKIQIFVDDGVTAFGTGGEYNSTLLDCEIDPALGYCVIIPPSTVTGQRIRLFVNPVSRDTAPEDFWWGGRFWAGPMKTMLRHHQFGHTEKWAENKFEETIRSPSIPLQRIKESEIDDMKTFEQLTVTKRQFLFIRDTDDPNKTSTLGKRTDTSGYQSLFFQNYGTTLQQQETW